jgi:hypothetical protein
MQKEKRTKAIVTCVAIAIPLLFLFSMFLLIPTLARLREDGKLGGPYYRKDTIEMTIKGKLEEGRDYRAIDGGESFEAVDCMYEELDGVYFHLFKSGRGAKRALRRIKNSHNYLEGTIVSTKNTFAGELTGVCDASIAENYYRTGNLLIEVQAVFGEGPMPIEDQDIQAEYNAKVYTKTTKAIETINELFMK